MTDITQSDGYKRLRAAVDKDFANDRGYQDGRRPFHDYEAKFQWAIERAQHYGEALDMDPADILDAWEKQRDYWYMNYYQEVKQPTLDTGKVRVFETVDDMLASIEGPRFRCPHCDGVSSSPYVCDSGIEIDGKECDWKAHGLFGTLGKGASVYVKSELRGETIFMPIAWETSEDKETAA